MIEEVKKIKKFEGFVKVKRIEIEGLSSLESSKRILDLKENYFPSLNEIKISELKTRAIDLQKCCKDEIIENAINNKLFKILKISVTTYCTEPEDIQGLYSKNHKKFDFSDVECINFDTNNFEYPLIIFSYIEVKNLKKMSFMFRHDCFVNVDEKKFEKTIKNYYSININFHQVKYLDFVCLKSEFLTPLLKLDKVKKKMLDFVKLFVGLDELKTRFEFVDKDENDTSMENVKSLVISSLQNISMKKLIGFKKVKDLKIVFDEARKSKANGSLKDGKYFKKFKCVENLKIDCKDYFDTSNFKKMKCMKVLILHNTGFDHGNFINFSKLKNLIVLEIKNCNVKGGFKDFEIESKSLKKIEVNNIKRGNNMNIIIDCENLNRLSISDLRSVETIVVASSSEISIDFCEIQFLSLEITCTKLKYLDFRNVHGKDVKIAENEVNRINISNKNEINSFRFMGSKNLECLSIDATFQKFIIENSPKLHTIVSKSFEFLKAYAISNPITHTCIKNLRFDSLFLTESNIKRIKKFIPCCEKINNVDINLFCY